MQSECALCVCVCVSVCVSIHNMFSMCGDCCVCSVCSSAKDNEDNDTNLLTGSGTAVGGCQITDPHCSHCVSPSVQLYSCVRPCEEDCTLSAASNPHSPLPYRRELDSAGRSTSPPPTASLCTLQYNCGHWSLHCTGNHRLLHSAHCTALPCTALHTAMICAVIWLSSRSEPADQYEPMK